jgi:hypothetical protein
MRSIRGKGWLAQHDSKLSKNDSMPSKPGKFLYDCVGRGSKALRLGFGEASERGIIFSVDCYQRLMQLATEVPSPVSPDQVAVVQAIYARASASKMMSHDTYIFYFQFFDKVGSDYLARVRNVYNEAVSCKMARMDTYETFISVARKMGYSVCGFCREKPGAAPFGVKFEKRQSSKEDSPDAEQSTAAGSESPISASDVDSRPTSPALGGDIDRSPASAGDVSTFFRTTSYAAF